ncbi:hypothetical protein NP233_g13096 [Leucocoprinus birnbaumii]|uniref:TEA domain-containing protein n=1 Tax=Leucocoprinus birnbaumii TaxID=56174 RepID=A0AAD5VIW8_9AGAR|nr:hypothetical protein NP233_g13096 [Leucocoprinus birnbaumii]
MYLNSFQVQGNFESSGSTAHTITTMTIDDLSSTYSTEQTIAVMHQRGATGRRCHKTLKSGGEAVWPPSLEAALIAGLQVYSDRHRVHMKHRGRFIGRNHFLSDYVNSVTSKRRTAKQVGSRLQQLKDTCCELRILYLITGSRSPSPRSYHRRGRKSSPKTPSRRSVSSSPDLSDKAFEESPEPCAILTTHEYAPLVESPPFISNPTVSVCPSSPVYKPSDQCYFTNGECNTTQYYTSPQCYSNEWVYASQATPSALYTTLTQQLPIYYPTVESQLQIQYAYHYDSQYY